MTINARQFASDNWSGICPEALDALIAANEGHVHAYGDDPYTEKACALLRDLFETDCEIFFTFNGTAANSLALAHLCRNYHSIICHELAHIETDECGAAEFFSNGAKVLLVPGVDGKVDLRAVENTIQRRQDIHFPTPHVLSLTQSTELGTVYTPDELRAATALARQHRLHVHMDGARFANALASLNAAPKEITWQAGVDVLCLGGSKNGLPVGEAVIFFNRGLAHEFDYRCKQAGQLASKMRFLSAPWIGLIETGAFLRNAQHANAMAARLETELRQIPGVQIRHPRQANAVFLTLEPKHAQALQQKGWHFYQFIGEGGIRLMCSWDTTLDDIEMITQDLKTIAAN